MLFMIESNYHVWCDSITKIFIFLSYFIDKNSLVFVFLFDMANTILLNYFSKFCFVLCNDIKFKVKIETLCGKQNIWNIQWNITSNLLQNNLWTNKLWILRFCRIVYYACFFLFFVLFCCFFFVKFVCKFRSNLMEMIYASFGFYLNLLILRSDIIGHLTWWNVWKKFLFTAFQRQITWK